MKRVRELLAWTLMLGLFSGGVARATPEAPRNSTEVGCTNSDPLPPVSETWVDIEPDSEANPAVPGFIQLVQFRSQPSGVTGHALAVRLSSSNGEPPLFRGEKRAWAVQLCDGESNRAIGYSYLDPDKLDDLWVYDPRLRRVERKSHAGRTSLGSTLRICDALAVAGLADGVEILERTTGRLTDLRRIRRAINPRLWSPCP
jgi:hypothetical protein